jgi:hypothetical protein
VSMRLIDVCTTAMVGVRVLYCVCISMTFLCQSFDMKDLGEADVILNIKLIKRENEITLMQSHYVEMVLSHFGYKDSKPSPTSYDPSLIL